MQNPFLDTSFKTISCFLLFQLKSRNGMFISEQREFLAKFLVDLGNPKNF